MASVVAYLTKDPDPAAAFRFRLGDRVISTLDTAMSGVIVRGRSRYTPDGGPYEAWTDRNVQRQARHRRDVRRPSV